MRSVVALSFSVVAAFCAPLSACSGGNSPPGFGNDGSSSGTSSSGASSSSGSSGGGSNGSSGGSLGSSASSSGGGSSGGDGGVTTKTTVYANSDHNLFSVDPMTKAVTLIGPFSDTTTTFTDVAVNGNGDVYVNSETAVYKCTLPASGTGTVQVMQIATIAGAGSTDKFYALAFAPVGSLDPNNEVLIGGDGNGVLWSIDTSTGATKQLGSFGVDPTNGLNLGLSGDMVFYMDASNNPVGLATIRESSKGNDWLAGVDMAAMKTAYTSGTPAATLLKGVYGGTTTSLGPGTGFHDVFGLGAWNATVFGFTRSTTNPQLITIDTCMGCSTSGQGTAVPGTVTFPSGDSGWSGAGVTTKVTVNVPQPPPPPQ
jgi:hypothetical protein